MPKYVVNACILCWLANAAPQPLGTLTGIVCDRSDAAIPSASVELSHPVNGSTYRTETGLDGRFVLRGIPPNTYTMRIAKAGFELYRADLPIRGFPVDLDVHLELAGQRTSVTVDAT